MARDKIFVYIFIYRECHFASNLQIYIYVLLRRLLFRFNGLGWCANEADFEICALTIMDLFLTSGGTNGMKGGQAPRITVTLVL